MRWPPEAEAGGTGAAPGTVGAVIPEAVTPGAVIPEAVIPEAVTPEAAGTEADVGMEEVGTDTEAGMEEGYSLARPSGGPTATLTHIRTVIRPTPRQ
jgi:hypothetical protein